MYDEVTSRVVPLLLASPLALTILVGSMTVCAAEAELGGDTLRGRADSSERRFATEGAPTASADPTPLLLRVNQEHDAADGTPGDGCCDVQAGNARCVKNPSENICTLRAAVQEANAIAGPDTILLPTGTYRLSMVGASEDQAATGDLDVLDELSVEGEGAPLTIIDAGFIDRAVHVFKTTTFSRVTIRNGDTTAYPPQDPESEADEGQGGGVYFDLKAESGETLAIRDAVLAYNTSPSAGGGVFNGRRRLAISGSTISGNVAFQGGGIDNNRGRLELVNSTITGNRAINGANPDGSPRRGRSGGIANGRGVLDSVTISASFGDGNVYGRCSQDVDLPCPVEINPDNFNLLLLVKNSIIDGTCRGYLKSEGYNLFGSNPSSPTCRVDGVIDGNRIDSPRLGSLAYHGGRIQVPTHALLRGSPAVDEGGNCGELDARGVSRPQGPRCDIGAYEARPCDGQPGGSFCDDGEGCPSIDMCVDGTCVSGEVTSCDDADDCTADSCDVAGCQHVPTPGCPPYLCGNGILNGGNPAEQCDQGAANGMATSCCDIACRLKPTSEVCRPIAGGCDVAETCDGRSSDCPPDQVVTAETTCRPAVDVCDEAEKCSGTSKSCPEDKPFGGVKVCRAASQCDEAEECDGANTSCPRDRFKPDGATCELSGCSVPLCIQGTCACQLCGNGEKDQFEECDHLEGNSDSEDAGVCCSTQCKFQAGRRCRVSKDTCLETSICADNVASCPPLVPAGRGKPCVLEGCTFNSSCEDGECRGGTSVCAVEVRQSASRRGLPKIEVRCVKVGKKQRKAHCESRGYLFLASILSPDGQDLLIASQSQRALQARLSSKCSRAAGAVRGSCGPEIANEVFVCSAAQGLSGVRFKECKPSECGKSLTKLAMGCPQAMKSGLNSKVVTRITGLKVEVEGRPTPLSGVSTEVAKTCSGIGDCL